MAAGASLQLKCAAAGLFRSLSGNHWYCDACGLTMSNVSEKQDLFSAHSRASPTCSFCRTSALRGSTVSAPERLTYCSAGNHFPYVMPISSTANPINVDACGQSPEVFRQSLSEQLLSVSSEELSSWISSFGSIETVPEFGSSSQYMTDGRGERFPPSSSLPPSSDPGAPSLPPPRYPEYSTFQSRLDSYVGWPERVVGVRPPGLAACGFFYIGSADRVRCFQCGITLRNWEAEDDPATEHVTWAPHCPVALLPPGGESQTGFRDVRAPPDRSGEEDAPGGARGSEFESASRNVEQLGVEVTGAAGSNQASATVEQSHEVDNEVPAPQSNGPTLSESGTSGSAPGERNSAVQDNPAVLAVLEMGFSRAAVDRVRERRRQLLGEEDFPDAPSLLSAILDQEANDQITSLPSHTSSSHQNSSPEMSHLNGNAASTTENATDVTPSAVASADTTVTSGNQPSASPREGSSGLSPLPSLAPPGGGAPARRNGLRFRQCRLCLQGEVTVTFLPCGHLIACQACASKTQRCPRCGKTILGTIKTYFA